MQVVTVGRKRQVIIPSDARVRLGWMPGVLLVATLHNKELVLAAQSRISKNIKSIELGLRYQVTLPVELCRAIDVIESTRLSWRINRHRLVLTPNLTRMVPDSIDVEGFTREVQEQKHVNLQRMLVRKNAFEGLTAVWRERRKRRPRKRPSSVF